MAEQSIRSSSYAVLLLVALRGPSSPYDLKRAVSHIASQFWAVPHTQVYQETRRLAAEGLLAVSIAEGGRRRQTYTLTEAGRDALQSWLAEPAATGMEIRDEAQLKLMGTELSNRGAVQRLAREQAAQYRERLETLEKVAATQAGRELRLLAVPFGLAIYRAALDFWTGLADDPPGPDDQAGL